MKKVIAITGVATSGKDSTFKILSKYIPAKRFAFADKLKNAARPLCLEYFGIDPLTATPKDKETIRDFLVVFGGTARKINHRVWIEAIKPDIEKHLQVYNDNVVITDLRFDEFDDDEYTFAKNELNGIVVNVDRVMPDGGLLPPANASEAANYPRIKTLADVKLTASNLEELEQQIVAKILPLFV